MTTESIKEHLIVQLDKLPHNLQLHVLIFAKSLAPTGVEGKSLLRSEGTITANGLKTMSAAIEMTCERIDSNEW